MPHIDNSVQSVFIYSCHRYASYAFLTHSKSSVIAVLLMTLSSHHPTRCNANVMQAPNLYPCPRTDLSISHTRLHISRRWILRASIVTSIPMPTATASLPLLRATHPQPLRHGAPSPTLVHGRHHWLRSARLSWASAASYDATKDRKQQKTADTTAYPDNEVAIVMNPATNLFGSA